MRLGFHPGERGVSEGERDLMKSEMRDWESGD